MFMRGCSVIRSFTRSSEEDIENAIDYDVLDGVSSLAFPLGSSEGDDQGMNIHLF